MWGVCVYFSNRHQFLQPLSPHPGLYSACTTLKINKYRRDSNKNETTKKHRMRTGKPKQVSLAVGP
jgi:hypothetical protein